MEKNKIKIYLLSGLVAVFAGVMTLGVNAALSVEDPAVNPADAGLVSPRFGGLDVQGEIKNNKTLNGSGYGIQITDPEGTSISTGLTVPKIVNGSSSATPLLIDDQVEITGQITNPSSQTINNVTTPNPILLNDNLYVSGNMDSWGGIKNTGSTGSGASTVQNPVLIDDTDGLNIKGEIKNSSSTYVTINDGLKIGGQFANIAGGLIQIVDGIKILAGGVTIDSGGLNVTGGIQNPGTTALGLTDPQGIELSGPIFSNSNNIGRMPRVDDTDGFDVWGPIQNNKPDTGSGSTLVKYAVKIADILEVTDIIRNPNTTGLTAVKINDDLQITGSIKNPDDTPDQDEFTLDGAVNIDDHIKVGDGENKKLSWFYGDLAIKATKNCVAGQDCGGVTAMTDGSLNIEGDAIVSKNISAHSVTTTDAMTVGGHLFMDHNTLFLSEDSWIHQTNSGPLSIKAKDGRNLELKAGNSYTTDNSGGGAYMQLKAATTYTNGAVTAAINNPKVEIGAYDYETDLKIYGNTTNDGTLTISGKTKANGGLSITGKATATEGFGTYTRRVGAFLAVPKDGIAEASSGCNNNEIIISCGAQASDTNTDLYIGGGLVSSGSYTPSKYVSFTNLDPYDKTCYARGSNKDLNNVRFVRAIAMCLNPGI